MFKRPFATAGFAAVTMLCSMFLIAGCPQPADTGAEDPGQDQSAGQNDQNQAGGDQAGDDAAKGNDGGNDPGNNGDNSSNDNAGGDNSGNDNAGNNDGNNNGGNNDFPTEPPPGYTYDDLWALLAEYEQTGTVTWDLNLDGLVNQQDLGILIWLLWLQDHQ